jgi:hypothetical protein
VGGLEDGVAGDVVDVAARGDADAADLRRERVGEVVAVEVQRGDHVELLRAGEHLLERDVGDGVLDQELLLPLALAVGLPQLQRGLDLGASSACARRAPCRSPARSCFALSSTERSGFASLLPRIQLSRSVTTGRGTRARRGRSPSRLKAPSVNFMMLPLWTMVTLLRLNLRAYSIAARMRRSVPSRETGLMPMPRGLGEADLLHLHLVLEERDDLLGLGALGLPLDAGVDVLGVLAEDHHVDVLRGFTGLGTPLNQRTGRRQT